MSLPVCSWEIGWAQKVHNSMWWVLQSWTRKTATPRSSKSHRTNIFSKALLFVPVASRTYFGKMVAILNYWPYWTIFSSTNCVSIKHVTLFEQTPTDSFWIIKDLNYFLQKVSDILNWAAIHLQLDPLVIRHQHMKVEPNQMIDIWVIKDSIHYWNSGHF